MSKTTATKAITVFLTGATTWAGVNLPAAWAGAFGVITATVLAFLVPNAPVTEAPPMSLRLGRDSGAGDIVSVVVIIILLLIVCRIFGLL